MVMEWKNVRCIITRPSDGGCCFVAVHSVAGAKYSKTVFTAVKRLYVIFAAALINSRNSTKLKGICMYCIEKKSDSAVKL